jgi:hypothetical protein
MSGLDPSTEEHIFTQLLGPRGLLKITGTTVIMVTNSSKLVIVEYEYSIPNLDQYIDYLMQTILLR